MVRQSLKTKGAFRLQPGALVVPLWLVLGGGLLAVFVYGGGFELLGAGGVLDKALCLIVPLLVATLIFFLWLKARWNWGRVIVAEVVDVRYRERVAKASPRGHGGRRGEYGWDLLCRYIYRAEGGRGDCGRGGAGAHGGGSDGRQEAGTRGGREICEWLRLVRGRNRSEAGQLSANQVDTVNLRLLEVRFLGIHLWQAGVMRRDNEALFRQLTEMQERD